MTRQPRQAAPGLLVVFGSVMAAVAMAGVVLAVSSQIGGFADAALLADPGAFSRWGLLVTRVAYDLAAVGTLGVLLVGVVLLPSVGGELGADAVRLVRLCARWSAAWAVAAVLGAAFTLSDAVGLPVWAVLAPDVLPLATELPQTRALLSSAWLAGLVAVWARWTPSAATGRLLLLTAAAALLPPLLNGHAGHGDDHVVAVTSLAVHVGAAAAWVGGLAALALHLRSREASLVAALPRYSRAALACFVAVALSGAITGWVALGSVDQLWTTGYGRLLLVKAAALVVLGGFGHRHRRRTVAAVASHRPRAFLALAVVELIIMAGTVALAVGLSRTAPPAAEPHAATTSQVQPGPASA